MHENLPPHLTTKMKGPPKFEVGLSPIALENWLFPDDQSHWLAGKGKLLDEIPQKVFGAFNDSLDAQIELAQMVANVAGVQLNPNENPLIAASRLVSDDLIIMDKREGNWQVVAATLCAPTFFDAAHALGKSLLLLHDPVPSGSFGLSERIARIFDNFAPEMVLERFNWTVQWGDERYTPNGAILREMAKAAPIDDAEKMLFERVERQTIRKLPNTGAIVFTIRIRLSHLAILLQSGDEYSAFENAWNNAPLNVREYKKWETLERHVAHLLTKFK